MDEAFNRIPVGLTEAVVSLTVIVWVFVPESDPVIFDCIFHVPAVSSLCPIQLLSESLYVYVWAQLPFGR